MGNGKVIINNVVLKLKDELYKKRKVILISVLSLLMFVGLAAGSYTAVTTFIKSDLFLLNNVVVKGCSNTEKIDIIKTINLVNRTNIFDVDINKIKTRLETLPWIKSVKVRLNLPDRLEIDVKERKAFVVAKISGQNYIVGDDGYVIKKISNKNNPDIDKLTFTDHVDIGYIKESYWRKFSDLREIFNRYKIFGKPVIYFENGKGVIANIDGIKVIFGNSDFEKKMKRLKKIFGFIKNKGIKPKEVDLSLKSNGIIKLSDNGRLK